MEAPMLPDEPALLKHPVEGVLFWREDAEQIAEVRFQDGSAGWKRTPKAQHPCEADYRDAIKSGVGGTPERLSYLRMRLWWAGNDAIRAGEKANLSEEHLQNLIAFAPLLSEANPDQRLMKAEFLRELGRFADAEALLKLKLPNGYEKALGLITNLASARRKNVEKIPN